MEGLIIFITKGKIILITLLQVKNFRIRCNCILALIRLSEEQVGAITVGLSEEVSAKTLGLSEEQVSPITFGLSEEQMSASWVE